MINELFEKELRNTSINGVSLADYIKENYILRSVIEDTRKEIKEEADGSVGEIGDGLYYALDIMDKHISRKENN